MRVFPTHIDIADEPMNEEKIASTLTERLVRDMDAISRLRVLGLRQLHIRNRIDPTGTSTKHLGQHVG